MDFSTFLVLDVKTTLWETDKDKPAGQNNEIIGVDVAVIDSVKNEVIEHEVIFVKPKKAKISAYCQKIYNISQTKLDTDGVSFEQAYRRLRIHYMSRDRLWGSWGRYDKYSLDKQCKLLNIEPLFVSSHIDIQHLYCLMTGSNDDTGGVAIHQALKNVELKHTDNDAYNVASLYMRMAKGLRPTVKTRIVVPAHQYKNVN